MHKLCAIAFAAAALALSASCKRPEDQAARQRIFSPEQPQGIDAKAKEPLDAHRLAGDAKLAARVLHMSRAEVATRLGAHQSSGKVQFTWSMGELAADAGPNQVTLTEESSLTQAQGGDFRVSSQNDRNQGFEAVLAKGEIYVRSRFGPFRKRRTDRADVQRLREQSSPGLATFDQLARGLKLRMAGDTTVDRRRAVRYEVAGSGAAPKLADESDLPAIQWPTGGPDPDTARRLSLWEKETPVEVDGSITIDAETAAPLAWDLRGHFRVAPEKSGIPADLELTSAFKTSGIGKDHAVAAPAFEPEPTVAHAVKEPLRFLGKDAPPAGGTAAAVADEPEDEAKDESEAEPAEAEAPAAAPASKP